MTLDSQSVVLRADEVRFMLSLGYMPRLEAKQELRIRLLLCGRTLKKNVDVDR